MSTASSTPASWSDDAVGLRAMTRQDLAAVADIVATTDLWHRHGLTRPAILARLETGLSQGATIDVAVASDDGDAADRVAGFVWYVRQGAFARSGYVMLIGVAAAWRGRGVGAALMARAEAELGHDAEDVMLLVSDFNTAGQRFYTRLGYQQVGALPDYVTPGITELIYRKRIAKGKVKR